MAASLQILYRFRSEQGDATEFAVHLDPRTLIAHTAGSDAPPHWMQLDHHRCPDCPLPTHEAALCPMAVALGDLLRFARDLVSHSSLDVTVVTPEREIHAVTSAQRALSSLMGLLMATSACPDIAWLRPMARFHLPLASEEETIYRAVSMYLLAQYFRQRHGAEPDHGMQGLRDRYQRLHVINVAMAKRLRSAVDQDASINAVVILDLFAKALPLTVEDSLSELEYLFRSYLD